MFDDDEPLDDRLNDRLYLPTGNTDITAYVTNHGELTIEGMPTVAATHDMLLRYMTMLHRLNLTETPFIYDRYKASRFFYIFVDAFPYPKTVCRFHHMIYIFFYFSTFFLVCSSNMRFFAVS